MKIGKANIKNISDINTDWYLTYVFPWAEAFFNNYRKIILDNKSVASDCFKKQFVDNDLGSNIRNFIELDSKQTIQYSGNGKDIDGIHTISEHKMLLVMVPLLKIINYNNDIFNSEPEFDLYDSGLESTGLCVIGWQNYFKIVLPSEILNVTYYKDYDSVTANLLPGDSKNSMMSLNELATKSVTSIKKEVLKTEIKKTQLAEMEKAIYKKETEGLKEIKAQLEVLQQELWKQQQAQLNLLNKKKEEMQIIMDKLQKELFVLETQIYSIRCFTGEVIEMMQLKSGRKADEKTPITLFQKMRYMDEELGFLASVYNVDYNKAELFEKLLQNCDEALETFLPNNKCISLLRCTKNSNYSSYNRTDGIMYEYKKLHGSKVAILIRNGENIYIGWTDENKISISDNAFLKKETKILHSDEIGINDSKEIIASRFFIFSILQGILEKNELLNLPVHVNLMNPSPYIILSYADGWISDNRFGTLTDMQEKVNNSIKEQDDVILLFNLGDEKRWVPSNRWSSGHFEDCRRSKENSNRTNGCSLDKNKVYKINYVETVKNEYTSSNHELFIRAEKEIWKGSERYGYESHMAGANFGVERKEILNLTYMNSVWVEYVIVNRCIGDMTLQDGSKYAAIIHALKVSLEFLKQREKVEIELIKTYCPNIKDINEWQVKLSEWKLENKVRIITNFQAKRFSRFLLKWIT